MPLISVIIATYNSSPFIVETLNSVEQQTWKDIELIVSDDNSADDTVETCHRWIDLNRQRFSRIELITSDLNTGVSANANRGLKSATGEWVKFIGADDTLLPDCLLDNMQFISDHPDIKILFSKIDIYKETFEKGNFIKSTPETEISQYSVLWSGRSVESQYRMLLLSDRIHFSPSVFLHRETLLSVGGFDERFRLLEDYPLWLNLTRNGHRLFYMDKVTVNYRQHTQAINNTGNSYLVNPNYFKTESFRKIYTYPNLPSVVRLDQQFTWYASQLFRYNWLNRSKTPNKVIHNLLTAYLNPFKYFIWLKKHFMKNLKNNEFYK